VRGRAPYRWRAHAPSNVPQRSRVRRDDGVLELISSEVLFNSRAVFGPDQACEGLDTGYTRGALYHRFKDNEPLVLAVLDLVDETWTQDVRPLVDREPGPLAALIALARGHAVFCRQDVARVMMALRLDFSGQDHPVGRKLERISESLFECCTRLIRAGRRVGTIPAGPPARAVALAFIGAVEGAAIELAGQAPHDEALAAHAAAGVLGLDHDAIP
jgi:AcrR family transcriptional regulator